MNTKYLITGIGGLLGSRLAKYIIDNDLGTVVGIDDFSGGQRDFVPSGASIWLHDLSESSDSLDNIFDAYKPDIVYHFAAMAAEGLSPFIRTNTYKNNIIASSNVINCCINHSVERLVFTSSMAVYGAGKVPFAESNVPEPVDPYGNAKLAVENDLRYAHEQFGLDYCIIRPHNVYGINQNIWDPYRNVLGIWMRQRKANQDITIYGDGNQKRAFSYIDDSLKPLYMAGISRKVSGEIINLGGIEEVSIKQAAEIFMGIEGPKVNIVHLEKREEVKLAWATHEKSQKLLGFRHETSLENGLQKMWNWVLQQPDRPIQRMEKYEIEKGIYSYWKNN